MPPLDNSSQDEDLISMMDEALSHQMAALLTPVLPYLIGPYINEPEKAKRVAFEKLGYKAANHIWDKAVAIWAKLQPGIENKPWVIENLELAALKVAKDPDSGIILSWELERLLPSLPRDNIQAIKDILAEEESQPRLTIASNRSVAFGGSEDNNIYINEDRPQ